MVTIFPYVICITPLLRNLQLAHTQVGWQVSGVSGWPASCSFFFGGGGGGMVRVCSQICCILVRYSYLDPCCLSKMLYQPLCDFLYVSMHTYIYIYIYN